MVGVIGERDDTARADPTAPHRLRPRRALLVQGLLASIVFLTPVFVVLYLVTAPADGWPVVLAWQAVATVAVFVGCARFFFVAIWVGATGIAERGFFIPRREFAIDRIAQIVRARVFAHGSDQVEQLFVCDAEGRCLVRMRGQFWATREMDAVAEALGVPVTVLPDVITLRELSREHPRLAYWFERF